MTIGGRVLLVCLVVIAITTALLAAAADIAARTTEANARVAAASRLLSEQDAAAQLQRQLRLDLGVATRQVEAGQAVPPGTWSAIAAQVDRLAVRPTDASDLASLSPEAARAIQASVAETAKLSRRARELIDGSRGGPDGVREGMPAFVAALGEADAARIGARSALRLHIESSVSETLRLSRLWAWWLLVGGVLLVTVMVGLTLWLRASVLRPTVRIAEALERLSDGHDDVEVDGVSRRDELGQLARGLSAFRETVIERRAAEQRAEYLAHHDALTGLGNRLKFEAQLEDALSAARAGAPIALLLLDLDGFKELNDARGHAAGDEVLRAVGGLLAATCGADAQASRVGGDEFAVIQRGQPQPGGARALAARILAAFATSFEQQGVGVSIGIAAAPAHGSSGDVLRHNADVALYRAKREGRGRACLYEPDADGGEQGRMGRDGQGFAAAPPPVKAVLSKAVPERWLMATQPRATGEMPVRNPRTGLADHVIRPLSREGVAEVVARARAGQRVWASLGPELRAAKLHALADSFEAEADGIAAALIADTGRRAVAVLELRSTIATIRRWAGQGPGIIASAEGQVPQPTAMPGVTYRTRLVPYPVVGVISPWNFPLLLSLIDAIPALAAGSAAVVKPSEVTPRFIGPVMRAVAQVPEVASVLTLIEGDGATGAAMVEQVDYVCFTGSVPTGRKVGEAAARAFVPASLELGGKDPLVVLASADPARAAEIALRASVSATGQACQSIERVYVARDIAEPFLAALVEKAKAVRLNHPDMASGDIGPFIFDRQAAIVQAQIDDAIAKGARLLAGGHVERLGGGLYLRPTVLVDVTPDMTLMQEETFGPVIPVTSFDTVGQAVEMANSGPYGLSAAVVAGTLEEAEAVAVRLEAGAVSINDGSLTSLVSDAEKSSFKLSGIGPSRMGASGLLRFLRRQALLRQEGEPWPLAAYAEETLR